MAKSAHGSRKPSRIGETQIILCEHHDDAECMFEITRSDKNKNVDIDNVGRILSPSILLKPVIQATGQKRPVLDEVKRNYGHYKHIILVFPLEFGSPLDLAPLFGSYYGVYLAPAAPDVFSWLLADPIFFDRIHKTKRIRDFPDYDTYLSQRQSVFLNYKNKRFILQKNNLAHYDPMRACMVSPTLRHFFRLLSSLQNREPPEFSLDLNKALLSNLLMESYPSEKEIYRSLDGRRLTGEQMVVEIKKGSDVAKKYTSDLLRVSRDLLARQAMKSAS